MKHLNRTAFFVAVALCALAAPALAQLGVSSIPAAPVASGGTIDIGQAFSNAAAPYINAAVSSLIAAAMGWLFWLLKTKLNVSIDAEHRDALTSFAQRQASSLVADGKVAIQGKAVTVDNAALANAANQALIMIPDVLKHFGITPNGIADRIKDAIPQVPAAAPAIAESVAIPHPAGTPVAA